MVGDLTHLLLSLTVMRASRRWREGGGRDRLLHMSVAMGILAQ